MALRVLLADESTTIKKVMQLALQDFAVEVKAVHAGVDVVEVTRSFQPDIIFADVLLQKKNGYEVCGDIKKDSELRSIPVVLMWSSFMDLDEKLAQQYEASGRLEKPFDVESLRQLVLNLVPKTRSQRLAHFLKFPDSITEPLQEEQAQKQSPPPETAAPVPAPPKRPPPPAQNAEPIATQTMTAPQVKAPAIELPPPQPEAKPASTWNMESFDDIHQFSSELDPSAEHEDLTPEELSLPTFDKEFSVENDESADEGFTEFKLTNLTASSARPAHESFSRNFANTAPTQAQQPDETPIEDQDPWSHQDLSRFKLDLPPVSIESDDFSLHIDLPEADLARPYADQQTNEFSLPPTPSRRSSPPALELESQIEEDELSAFPSQSLMMESLTALPEAMDDDVDRLHGVDLTRDYLHTSRQGRHAPSAQEPDEELELGTVPQLSAERLEEIIRSQSREIIESVVRRIVPDIASTLIKEELERLLTDTGVHDRTERENRR